MGGGSHTDFALQSMRAGFSAPKNFFITANWPSYLKNIF